MNRTFRILLFLFCFHNFGNNSTIAQVVINEVCSANDQLFPDEDGDNEDWIELYNPTASVIDLTNYSFIYTEGVETFTWTFPPMLIQPFSHLTIYASEKNRTSVIDHWEVPIFGDDFWKYQVNTASPPDTSWYQNTFNDASWPSAIGGFGYGDGDDNTDVTFAYSVFVRKNFNLTDTSQYDLGFLMIDYDDSFVAYLNGVEIARSNIGVYGDHPAYDTWAYAEHEAQLYTGGDFEFYLTTETMLNNALKIGNNVLAIQVNNYDLGIDDMSLLPYLIIGSTDTASAFPSFPSDFSTHTNFSLSSQGFNLILKNGLGTIVDNQTYGKIQPNNSRGRTPDGAATQCLFYFPTPKDTNDVSPCYGDYAAMPDFNVPAGFYTSPQTVSITVPPGTIAFYTTDGNMPTGSSNVYSGPITINTTKVIRARAFSISGLDLPSKTITNTYFINENINARVVSLCTDSSNLWDWNTGMYVMGPFADPFPPYSNANFWQDWKRQANSEFFDLNDQEQFDQECAVSIHGNYSRSWPQKSFRISANDDYGDPYINYKLFPNKDINKFKSFNIRNAGIDWNTCHFRDRLMHKMVNNLDMDYMDGEPVVLFLNGQYFGMYEMRERQDENYLSGNHNVDPKKVDLLRFEGDILEGTNTAFLNMVDYISTNSMQVQSNYDSASNLIDISNYCDYFISETYYNNNDWIWIDYALLSQQTNNIKFWRTNSPVSKWRYILWDTDLGMGLFGGTDLSCPEAMLGNIIDSIITSPSVHVKMLRSFLQNTEFKNYFINRYCDLMNTTFTPTNFKNEVYKIRDEMEPDMARHFTKWAGPISLFGIYTVGRSIDIPTWYDEIDSLVDFIDCRPSSVRDSLQGEFNFTKQVDVTLDVSPANTGTIKLNTITPGQLPWTGIYYDGNPITMTATPQPGYKFLYWKSNSVISGENKNSSLTINVDANDTFTAYFQELNIAFTAYPNPFNNTITLKYEIPGDMRVSINMVDVLGRNIAQLVSANEWHTPGVYEITIDTKPYNLASGIYLIKMATSEFTEVIKLVKGKE